MRRRLVRAGGPGFGSVLHFLQSLSLNVAPLLAVRLGRVLPCLTAGFGLDDSSRIDTLGGGKQMPLTGKDVWEAIVRLGLASGPYDPKTNRHCANAERIAGLLNEVLAKQEPNWLPPVTRTEYAMRTWEANTPREL